MFQPCEEDLISADNHVEYALVKKSFVAENREKIALGNLLP